MQSPSIKSFLYNSISDYITPRNLSKQDGIQFWREKILLILLLFTSAVGTLSFLTSSTFFHFEGNLTAFLVNLTIYLCIITFTIRKTLSFHLRAKGFILVNQLAASILLIDLGPFGTIPIWLTMIPLLGLLFLGIRFAITAFLGNLLIMIVTGFLNVYGIVEWTAVQISPPGHWIVIVFNFSVISLVVIVIFSMIIQGLYKSLAMEKEISRELTLKQEELLQSQEKLTREINKRRMVLDASEAKNEFIASISHEIRTPMHHILSYSKFGINKAGSVPLKKLVHYFSQIRKTSERLMYLLNDLLDLSKMESGRMELNFKICYLPGLVEEIRQSFIPILSYKNINLLIHLETDKLVIECDSYRMSQVIQNILSNAIRFSSENDTIDMVIRSDVITGNSGDIKAVTMEIKDQGVGIPANEIDSIFDKFVQSSFTDSNIGGTGLGLSISKKIVGYHQGKITAVNNIEGGATISITIPTLQSIQN